MSYHQKVAEACKKVDLAEREEKDVKDMGGAHKKIVNKVRKDMSRHNSSKKKGGKKR